MEILLIFVGAGLINNYVFTQFLGMCPFFGVSRRVEGAVGMGLSVTFVLVVSTMFTWAFYSFVLEPLGIMFLQTIAFVLIIAAIVQFLEVYMKKMFKSIYALLGVFLPLIATNCIILGVALINIRDGHNFFEAIVNSLGAGLGFLLAIVMMAVVREKYEGNPSVPQVFRGLPLALFAAGLMSLAFLGFQGLSIER